MSLQTIQSVFQESRPALPVALSARIILAIEAEAARKLQFRAAVASVCSFLSLILFFVSLAVVGNGLLASDFWQLAGLLFSDLSLVWAHSEAFLLSLAETLPAASLALLLLPLFFHLATLVFRARYMEAGSVTRLFQLNIAH